MGQGGDSLSNFGPDEVQNLGRSVFLGSNEQRALGMSAMMRENHFENRQEDFAFDDKVLQGRPNEQNDLPPEADRGLATS